MIKELSIVIPCFNCDCTELVKGIAAQCQKVSQLKYEIIIADDGSTDDAMVSIYKELSAIPNVEHQRLSKSKNRSAMRNRLSELAHYEWQLQVNANVHVCHDTFIERFVDAPTGYEVVCGTTIAKASKSNLRSVYENHFSRTYSIEYNNAHPYSYFRNTCCMYHRCVFEKARYDESINGYGYEDTDFGMRLKEAGCRIWYIDNPVEYGSEISNEEYLRNTEEALKNLYLLRDQLKEMSPLLRMVGRLQRWHVTGIVRMMHRLLGGMMRRVLCSQKPQVLAFSIYKLGYYLSIEKEV